MKRSAFFLALLIGAATIEPLRGGDVRVEWLSGKPIQALTFEPGAAALRLCSLARPQRCLEVEPGATARCVRSGATLHCDVAGSAQQFGSFTATSTAAFRLEAGLTREASPAGIVRAAEVRVLANRLRVVIPVELESYVAGVLEGEAAALHSPAALQAMAVVARTWALRWHGRHRAEGFDFCSLTHCQVFHLPSESSKATLAISRAVRETSGRVLKYREQLIDPYFSANCGGITEAAGDAWPDRAAPYLVSVTDPYCAGDAHSSWQQVLARATVASILSENLNIPVRGSAFGLSIEERDSSGRAHTLRLEGSSSRLLDANEFRFAVNRRLGWNTLKSSLYTLERRGDSLVFTGRGLGHGVGLCQAGAEQMGRMGNGFERILATYFPGTVVSQSAPSALSDPVLSSEHFELVFPESQQPLASETLQALESIRRELASRIEMPLVRIRAETFASTADFIHASKQPGWAAASTDGVSILLQPLSTLRRKNILTATLRHELAHLAVHRLRSRDVPRWFEEGVVLYLTGERLESKSAFDFGGRSLDESVSQPRSEVEMRAAYALALARVRRLAQARGESAVWQNLEHPSESDIRWLHEQE